MRKRYEIEWGSKYKSTTEMIKRMSGKRNPKSVNTIALYCHGVLIFSKHYLKTDPDKALEQTRQNPLRVVDGFVDYLMEKKGYTAKTVRALFYGVKFWLETNDVNISELNKIELPSSSITKTFDRSPTRTELEKLLTFADIRGKALIEIAVSSGLRLDTILSLTWKDYNEKDLMIKVEPSEGRKSGKPFFTFITPEASKTLNEYKEWRIRQGETLTEDSYLIANYTNPHKKLIPNSVQVFWTRLLKQAGLTEKSHKYHVLHFHVLRKFFKTACTNSNIRREYIEFWMGHSGLGMDDSYFRASIQDHKREYQKAIPQLSITEAQKEMDALQIAKQQALTSLRIALTPEAYKQLEPLILQAKSTEAINETLDKIRSENKHRETIDCQKIVSENELEAWLKKGFRFVSVLPSGKILISNET
jgi:integrase